jgi:hypothetical protein
VPAVAAVVKSALVTVALVLVATLTASAQRRGGGFGRFSPGIPPQADYDGSFTFARLYYGDYPGWSYDFPEMEQNLTSVMNLITNMRSAKHSDIVRMDDPTLFRHPIAYISEPGYWFPTDAEARTLREYLDKGGFLIIDDFHYDNEWAVFESAMRKVMPDAKIVKLEREHPIFNTFFDIPTLHVPYPGALGQRGLYGEFYGIHRDNDPEKPLQVVIDYNMDIGDYMEWSGSGFYAVDPSNEAFKFMINYLIYGNTR